MSLCRVSSNAYLVTVSPEEVLGPDVLVRIFHALLQGREVFPVFPMLIPQVPGVDASEDEAGCDDTVTLLDWIPTVSKTVLEDRTRLTVVARDLPKVSFHRLPLSSSTTHHWWRPRELSQQLFRG